MLPNTGVATVTPLSKTYMPWTHIWRVVCIESPCSKSPMTIRAKQVTMASTDDQTCKICRRTFSSFQSLRQHRESVKHKPLSALRCPIGKGCRGEFSAPSALLHHLESGKCCSGMDRDDVYDIIQLYDKDDPFQHAMERLPVCDWQRVPHCSREEHRA